ncbi:hypothetical protein F5Y13DRAFT_188544 [Hypoxylon sp. FL1857]|nr:hypothetical protein F5Y13DRAFT_188544 [Hypoxylon sp. FL1857]
MAEMATYGSKFPFHVLPTVRASLAFKIAWAEGAFKAGEDVNTLHPYDGTALHVVMRKRNVPSYESHLDFSDDLKWVEWLLDHGADPRLRDGVGGCSAMDDAILYAAVQKEMDSPIDFFVKSHQLMVQAAKLLEVQEAVEKEYFTSRDPNDDKCVLCRWLPEREANPPKDCSSCKAEEAYHWDYPPVGEPPVFYDD